MMSFREFLREYGDENPPRMRYQGDNTPASFSAWQEQFLAKLKELRGEPLPVPETQVELLHQEEQPDHIREHITIDSVLGSRITAHVLIPRDGSEGPRPGVLALHGHSKLGKEAVAGVADPGRGYGLAAVRAGFVILCPDWWGWAEREEKGFDFGARDKCNVMFMAAQMYGLPLLSLMVGDAEAALNALLARPDVDPKRVAAMGNSFGGRMSMYIAAFDKRVGLAVCSGCLNCFRERSLKLTSCGAQFFPGMLRWGDVQEVFSLIAPRPLMVMSGRKDPLLPHEYVAVMKPVIERAYHAAGAPENLTFYDHEGGHVLLVEPAIQWLKEQFDKAASG